MNSKQKRILQYLNELDSKIGSVYYGAISVLKQNYPEKISQSAHSIREVIEYLIRFKEVQELGRLKNIKTKNKTNKQQLVDSLDPLGGVPKNIQSVYDDLLEKHRKYFLTVTHHNKYPTESEYNGKIAEFESALEKIIRPHFEGIKSIDKILFIQRPTKSDFEELKQFITKNKSSYDYFFQNADRRWLDFLISEKHFDNPLHIIKKDKTVRFPVWIPGIYLTRIANKEPKKVLEIILGQKIPKIIKERNLYILENFVNTAINTDLKHSRKIARKIYDETWLDSPYYNVLLGESISKLMKIFTKAEFKKETFLLAKTLFDVKLGVKYAQPTIQNYNKTIQDVTTILDDYFYEEIMRNDFGIVYEKFPCDAVFFIVELLNKTISLDNKGHGNKKSKTDASHQWRPAIENHLQNSIHDFKSLLVTTLAEFMISEGSRSMPSLKKELEMMKTKNYPVFRRIELYIYSSYSKKFKKDIENSIISHFDRYELKHEYYHMLKETFSLVSVKTKKKYLKLVEQGPKKDLIEFWEENISENSDDNIEQYIKNWKAQKLEPIVKYLDKKYLKQYQELIKKASSSTLVDFNTYHSGVKTSKPVTELKDNLSIDEVFSFIKNHVHTKQDFGFHDGTSRKFQEYVTNNPLEYSKKALKLKRLDTVFSYHLFRGIEEGLKEKKKISWKPVLSLCRHLIDMIKKEEYARTIEYNLSRSIADILDFGLQKDSIRFNMREQIWKILTELVNLENEDDSWESNYPNGGWDSHAISINTTAGKTFDAIIEYARWCNRHLKTTNKIIFVPEIKKILSDYFIQKIPNTISRHSVLGLQCPTLMYFDQKWIQTKLSYLFRHKNEILNVACWDSYLLNRVYGSVFKELYDEYLIHVKKLKSPKLTKDGNLTSYDEHLIQHVTSAYFFKIKNGGKIFDILLENSHEKVLSFCSNVIFRILQEQKKDTSKYFDLDAMKKIWRNSKLTENKNVGWWFEYSPFGGKETIQLLLNSLEKNNGKINYPFYLQKKLVPFTNEFPLEILRCVELMIKSDSSDFGMRIDDKNIRVILETTMKSKKKKIVTKTISLINYLGTINHNEYKDLLDQA